MDYDLYPVERYEDYKACERLQSDVFGYADLDVVPYQLLRSFATSGGAVIGAFDGGSLIGFVVGYTGLLDDGTPYHRSQRLAVLPGYRGQGVGETLKYAQADLARRRGLHLMCWTFDPLRSINAHLNIHKLGAISRRYMANAYAASSSPLNAGVDIDRLWVEWDLCAGADAHRRPDGSEITNVALPFVLRDVNGLPSSLELHAGAPEVWLQIPWDVDAVRARDISRVVAWREATRQAFTHCFEHGYRVTDFVRGQGYLLSR